jgi:hypothetical protein
VCLGLAAAPLAAAEPVDPPPALPAAAEGPACAAWPGEPAPLPAIGDVDPFRAEWARLRGGELARVATALELFDRLEAHRLWQHAHCLDPANAEAAAGEERTRPSAVHRPVVRSPDDPGDEPATSVASALSLVARRVTADAVPRPAAPAPAARSVARRERPAAASPCGTRSTPCSELERVDAGLARIEEHIAGARFREALELGEPARARMRALDASAPSRARRVRLEVLCATAAVALGRDGDARAGFARVLALDPSFRLDPRRTAPKVQRAFDAARGDVARSGG